MLEKDIEKKVCDYAKRKGMLVYKFTSPNYRSVPDRMFIRKDGLIFFIEFKREGMKPTILQEREHEKLKDHNVHVAVIDNVGTGKTYIDLMGKVNYELR